MVCSPLSDFQLCETRLVSINNPPNISFILFCISGTETAAPIDYSETDTTDVPEFDDMASDSHSAELPVSEWGNGEYPGPDTTDGQSLPELYTNGIIAAGVGIQAASVSGDEYQDNLQTILPDTSFPNNQDSQILTE